MSNSDEALTSLVRVKAIERQYHGYFRWREGNRSVNPFFGMFGSTLQDLAKKEFGGEGVDSAMSCVQLMFEFGQQLRLLCGNS